MDFTELAFLAVVQGVTEFLPISSVAHVVLGAKIAGMERTAEQAIMLDIALHFGSLLAVMVYLWRDLRDSLVGVVTLPQDMIRRQTLRWPSKLALLLGLATVPLVLVGLFLMDTQIIDQVRDEGSDLGLKVIAWATLTFGILLYVADRFGPVRYEATDWGWRGALAMGVAQAMAIIPGVSRSGVTMTASRFLGFDRREGARLALLMSIPAILLITGKGVLDLLEAQDIALTLDLVMGAGMAFVSAYLALVLMMRWLSRSTFTPFVIYRLILGAVLLYFAYA